MHDLYKIANICLEEVKATGITPGNICAFTINRRLSRAWGRCKIERLTGNTTIEIQPFLLDDNTPLEVLKNTLIHEILHSCKACLNHGNLWQSYASRINARYGYHVQQYVPAESMAACLEAGTYPRKEKKINHILECTGCGQRIQRTKSSPFTQHPNFYFCGRCHKNEWRRIL